jgi:hypothetical protein
MMKVDEYCAAVLREVEWYLDALQAEGVAAVLQSAAATDADAMHEMIDQRGNELREIMVQPEDERAATFRQMSDATERHQMLLAAAHMARSGLAWLQAASTSAADTSVQIHPITMMLRTAWAAEELLHRYPSLWPFDDENDPFGEFGDL